MIQDVHLIKMINENLILLFFNVAFFKTKDTCILHNLGITELGKEI